MLWKRDVRICGADWSYLETVVYAGVVTLRQNDRLYSVNNKYFGYIDLSIVARNNRSESCLRRGERQFMRLTVRGI